MDRAKDRTEAAFIYRGKLFLPGGTSAGCTALLGEIHAEFFFQEENIRATRDNNVTESSLTNNNNFLQLRDKINYNFPFLNRTLNIDITISKWIAQWTTCSVANSFVENFKKKALAFPFHGGKKALEQSSCLLPFEIESKSDSLSSLAPLFFLPIYRWVRIIFGIKTVYDR